MVARGDDNFRLHLSAEIFCKFIDALICRDLLVVCGHHGLVGLARVVQRALLLDRLRGRNAVLLVLATLLALLALRVLLRSLHLQPHLFALHLVLDLGRLQLHQLVLRLAVGVLSGRRGGSGGGGRCRRLVTRLLGAAALLGRRIAGVGRAASALAAHGGGGCDAEGGGRRRRQRSGGLSAVKLLRVRYAAQSSAVQRSVVEWGGVVWMRLQQWVGSSGGARCADRDSGRQRDECSAVRWVVDLTGPAAVCGMSVCIPSVALLFIQLCSALRCCCSLCASRTARLPANRIGWLGQFNQSRFWRCTHTSNTPLLPPILSRPACCCN